MEGTSTVEGGTSAEIITLRAIALKLCEGDNLEIIGRAEIITLRAIALKQIETNGGRQTVNCRDHNATSYSTETTVVMLKFQRTCNAEIITLRAIALKRNIRRRNNRCIASRDHNATSYSTETIRRT